MPDSKQVFISHISAEAAIGAVVKGIIEDVFARDGIKAFLSSDMQDLPAGRKWLDEITEQLDEARVMVSLISPTSLKRPWVNIELGAGWIKGLRVIPLCHSGQLVGKLPRPFQDFNGVGLDQDDAPERLLVGIADGFGVVRPSKRLSYVAMLKELRDAAAGIEVAEVEEEAPAAATIPSEQVRILQRLATQANRGNERIQLEQLAAMAGVKPAAFTHHIHELSQRSFVGVSYFIDAPAVAYLRPDGSKWLIESGNMP
jgi:TIR domain